MTSSLPHLERHQRDTTEYIANVRKTAARRFGPAWWGVWDQHLDVAEGATVVDLGTGPGTFLEILHGRRPDLSLVGVELHPELIALGQQTADRLGAELVAADLGEPVPLDDGVADVVVSSLVFHELPYPPALLDTAARLLPEGGRLVLFDIVKWPLATYLGDDPLDADRLDHFREHCLFTPDDLAFLVDRAGFDVDEVVLRSGGRFAMVVATRRA